MSALLFSCWPMTPRAIAIPFHRRKPLREAASCDIHKGTSGCEFEPVGDSEKWF
jgi:hypothetical protein